LLFIYLLIYFNVTFILLDKPILTMFSL
jgi:hypothetical protein